MKSKEVEGVGKWFKYEYATAASADVFAQWFLVSRYLDMLLWGFQMSMKTIVWRVKVERRRSLKFKYS